MEPFSVFKAIAAPLTRENIDTDQILPARFLMMPRDDKYRTYLFRDLRLTNTGSEDVSFALNKKPFREARIIVAGKNFGCGSSREGAIFTLVDAGFRCVIAPSFGDIFYNNAFNNGLLAVTIPEILVIELQRVLSYATLPELEINLKTQFIKGPENQEIEFEIDSHRKEKLIQGLDPIDYTMQFESEISTFEAKYNESYPWT